MFVSPLPLPKIESLYQSTLSSLDSGSCDRNRANRNIQQQTTSEVSNTETVMGYNEYIDTPPLHDISNMFAAADLLSQSSYDSVKYKRACHRAKGIRSYILSSGESPDARSRSLSIAMNHKEIASIMAVTGTIFPKGYANVITRHKQKKYCHMQHLLEINKNKQKTEKGFSYPILCPLCHLHLNNRSK